MQRLGLNRPDPRRERETEKGVSCTEPHFQTQRDRDNHSLSGCAQDRQNLSPKISFQSLREGWGVGGRAAVEKQVISTAAGEQKAT